jgi:nucleoside 2-deoxyribosyltransferase
MLRPWLFVGFTGHRGLADPDRISGAIQQVLQRLERAYGPLAAVSSAARGSDTLFVKAAQGRQLPWLLLLPFPREEFRKDFSPEEWSVAETLMRQAVSTHIEPPAEANRPAGAARNDAFLECGIRTVDNCDVLVAVWDGLPARGSGGTGDIVGYARSQKKPMVWIHALTGAVVDENLAALPEAAPLAADLAVAPALDPREGGLTELQATLAYFDEAAVRHAPAARELITRMILLHLTATAVALLAPLLGFWAWVAFVLIMLKIIALIYADRLQHRGHQVHHEWLQHRIVAELCRSAVGTWPLRFSDRVHQPFTVPGFRGWQRSLLLWRLLKPPVERDVEAMKTAYDQGRMEEQICYFTTQLERAEKKLGTWRRVAKYSTRAAIACAVLVLVLLSIGHHTPASASQGDIPELTQMIKDVLKYFSLVLPLLSASVLHWLVAQDCGRRAVRNREMLSFLVRARERVRAVTTWSGLERLVSETETILLLEVLEWHSLSHFAGESD